MIRSRSSDAVPKLERELNQSQRMLSGNLEGETEESIDNAREVVKRHSAMLDVLTTNFKRGGHKVNKRISSAFSNKRRSSIFARSSILMTPPKTPLTEQFPIDTFAGDLTNPDLFSEVYPMAFLSASIFPLAIIRRAARKGKVDKVGQDIMSLPVASGSILEIFEANQSYFERKLKVVDYELMQSISRNANINDDTASRDLLKKKKSTLALLNAVTIEYFGDDHEESEAMYMITRNPMNKRIALTFRGSITIKDWVEDSKMIVSEIKNPVADRPNQPPTIGVHLGFGEYLNTETISNSLPIDDETTNIAERPDKDDVSTLNDRTSASETTTKRSRDSIAELFTYLGLDSLSLKEKQRNLWGIVEPSRRSSTPDYDKEDYTTADSASASNSSKGLTAKRSRLGRILDELQHLHQKYNDHRIYVSGHSLGGSLALLAGIEIAAKFGKMGQPVTAVCMANPRGGTKGFRDAVEVLEREGKMRCLSVQGRLDIIPMMPNSIMNKGTRRFCHSGFELILRAEAKKFYMRRSERNDKKYIKRMGLALIRLDKMDGRHAFTTYLKDLEALEGSMRKLHLNDFYDKFVEESVFATSVKKMTPLKVKVGTPMHPLMNPNYRSKPIARGRQSLAVVRGKTELKRTLSANDLKKSEWEE